MYNVSGTFKTAIKSPNRELRTKATCGALNLTSSDILSIKFSEAVNLNEEFAIGTATSSSIEMSINNVGDIYTADEFENKEITPYIGVTLPDATTEYVPLGIFLIEEALNDRNVINIKGFDRMIKFEKPYATSLTYPNTLLRIAQEICSLTGITLAATTFANADYIVTLKPELTGVTCRKAIAWVAELAGGFARISRDGKLEIVTLTTTDQVITKDNYYKLSKKDNPEIIDKVIVKTGEEQATAGAGTNVYYVSNNLFAQTPSNAVQGVYNVLNGLSFYPLETEWQGNPALKAGDKFTIDGFTSIVANQTITFKGGMRGKIKATGVSRTAKDYKGENSLQIIADKTKAEILLMKDEINLKVSQTDIDNSINAIEVGGRNLLLSSNNISNYWEGSSAIISQDGNIIRGVSNGGNPSWPRIWNTSVSRLIFDTSIKYTISFEIRVDASRNVAFAIVEPRGSEPIVYSIVLATTEWNKVVYTFTPNRETSQYIYNLQFYTSSVITGDTTSWIEIKNIKLEKGNKATDWTPAPEDVQANIDNVQANVDGANEALSTRINQAETVIQQTKDEISLKADKTVTDELGNVVEQHSTEISTLNNQFNVEITRIDGSIDGVKGDMTEVKSYMHFDEDGLALGKSNNPVQLSLKNDEVAILDSEAKVMYINGQKMLISTAEILNSLIVGQHKIEKYNDQITLIRWVGGN